MNKLIAFFLSLLIGSTAYAQQVFRYATDATAVIYATDGQMGPARIDGYGNQQVVVVAPGGSGLSQSVIPVSNATSLNGVGAGLTGWYKVGVDTVEAASTTTVINATSHGFRAGDIVVLTGGTAGNINTWSPIASVTTNTITLSNALPATPAAADAFTVQRPVPLSSTSASGTTNLIAALKTTLDASDQTNYQTTLLKLEDAAAATGDALVGVAGVANESYTDKAAEGDYLSPSLTLAGAAIETSVYDGGITNTRNVFESEDNAMNTDGAAGIKVIYLTQDPLAVNQTATNDAAFPKVDLAGRTITTLAPASERWQSCSASNTGTTDIAIKALVASNKICATSLSCFNTAAVASSIVFKSAATQIYVGGIGNSTLNGVADWQHSLPVPICTVAGEAFNFAMGTNATATTCCGAGFITVN